MMPLKNARITYPYGIKNSQYSKGYHTGIDLDAADYTLYACVSGTILEARYAAGKGADPAGWGNYVILRTTDGKYDIIHAHLASVAVTKGQVVSEGSVLGIMGSTGNSTGPHLHFEVRKAPWTVKNDIDPAVWLGIENKTGTAVSVPAKEAKKMFRNLILCNPGPDERAAGYLADHLGGPVCYLKNATQELLNCAQNIYVVGSKDKPVTGVTNIVGTDRYDTCRKVLDICQGR